MVRINENVYVFGALYFICIDMLLKLIPFFYISYKHSNKFDHNMFYIYMKQ